MNWDALEECLADLDLGGVDGVAVRLGGLGRARRGRRPRTSRSRSTSSPGRCAAGTATASTAGVLLVGEGPDVEVEEL